MSAPVLGLSIVVALAAFTLPLAAHGLEPAAPEHRRQLQDAPTPDAPRPGILKGLRWRAIPGSEMNSVFIPGTDDQAWMRPGAWPAIQAGWSGAACTGKELVLWGGGHSNGYHNGLLAVTPSGQWRRITEPSPVWTKEQCPDGVCPAATGPCSYGKCNTGPDGRPVSRHTYYLLGYRDGALYSVAGATAPSGAVGEPPRVWRYIMARDLWEPLPDTPAPLSHGSIVVVGRHLYHAGGWKGLGVLDLETLEWEARKGSNYGGQTGMVHVPTLDRIYMLGNGRFEWVERDSFGRVPTTTVPRKPGDEVLDARHLGLTYYAAEDVILAWNGGRVLHVIDPRTHTLTSVALPGDDPGPPLKNGTFGRLSDCGGRVMLVNGAGRPLYVLTREGEPDPASAGPRASLAADDDVSRGAADPDDSPAARARRAQERDAASGSGDDARERKREARRKGDRQERAGRDRQVKRDRGMVAADPSQPDWLTNPYYPQPPGGSLSAFDSWVDSVCGPRSQWSVVDVGPGHSVTDAAELQVGEGERVSIRLHPKETDHGALQVKKARCVEVLGVPDASGKRPIVNGINMTRGFSRSGQRIIDGGLIIRNIHVRHGKNDCIGSPNDGRFLSIEDSVVEYCGHHGVIVGRSPHFYFRSLRTTWRYADSHLVYINRIARSDLVDNVCEAPGWGHCLRSIARVSVMTGNRVSNVALDGSVPPAGSNPVKPKRTYLGMHPLDAYGCAEGRIADNTITYYRKAGTNIPVPINVRYRATFMGCEIAEHDGKAWRLLDPRSEEFQAPATWQRIRAAGDAGRLTFTVSDNVVRVFGPDREDHQTVGVQGGSLPLMGREDREGLAEWLRTWWSAADRGDPPETLWARMYEALPAPHWKRIADLVLPEARPRFMKGALQNSMPLPVPVGFWFQRQVVRVGPNTVSVCDDRGTCRPSKQPALRPESADFIYFGEPDPEKQFAGPTYRRARIEEVQGPGANGR